MIELDKVFAVLEILRYEGETLVVEGVLSRIFVLVKGVEMSRREALKDGTRVAAAAKGDVDIHTIGLDVEAFDAFLQHNRVVIHGRTSLFDVFAEQVEEFLVVEFVDGLFVQVFVPNLHLRCD